MASAEELKARGNEALKSKNFDEAIRLYSDAISLDACNHVFFSNRSAAYLSLGNGESALVDGEECIRLKPDWPKGYGRKAAALHKLGRLSEAKAVYSAGLEVSPGDASLAPALKSLTELMEQKQRASDSEAPTGAESEEAPTGSGTGAESAPKTEAEKPEWQAQSERYKDDGNAAFKAGDHAEAIRLYSLAIDLDPDSHVLFSNRSAAYLASGDAKSKALADAKRCLELKPDWAKAYVRVGAAETALGRYLDAHATLTKGLRLCPGDAGLEVGLAQCKASEERARAAAAAKARAEYEAYEAAEAQRKAADLAAADDLIDNFFGEVVHDEEKRHEEQRDKEAAERRARVQTEKTEKYTKQNLGTSEEQITRLVSPHRAFKNLNPYWVLCLDVDATAEDVKFRYKKLSLMVHPDKNLDQASDAQVAFDEVKGAFEDLCEEAKRDLVVETIVNTRHATAKERRRLINKGMKETDFPETLEEKQAKDVMKAFADIELRRRDTEKHLAGHRKREREQEDEQKAKVAAEEELNKNWTEGERVDERVSDWRGFQSSGAKKVDVKNYKQQERSDSKKPKFGAVEMESWRKSWK